jgi:hypothetical protein
MSAALLGIQRLEIFVLFRAIVINLARDTQYCAC